MAINGLLISNLSFFLGLRIKSDFDIYSSPLKMVKAEFMPVVRSFSLSSLYPKKLEANLQKYIDSNKHDLIEMSFGVLEQISENMLDSEYELDFARAKYELNKSPLHDFETAKKVMGIMEMIKESLDRHHWLQFRCSMLLI